MKKTISGDQHVILIATIDKLNEKDLQDNMLKE